MIIFPILDKFLKGLGKVLVRQLLTFEKIGWFCLIGKGLIEKVSNFGIVSALVLKNVKYPVLVKAFSTRFTQRSEMCITDLWCIHSEQLKTYFTVYPDTTVIISGLISQSIWTVLMCVSCDLCSRHGRCRAGLPDGWCRGIRHLPHAVLGPAQKRLCRAERPTLQDRWDVHLQDWQARPR